MNTLRNDAVGRDTPGPADSTRIDVLRAAMVDELRKMGAIATDRVAHAVLAVPRHVFAPAGEPLERVYAPTTAIVTKRNAHGAAISSLSEAHIQATMLEQAQIEPGMRVVEVGTGGCNASYVAELVGDAGEVISVDIDADIVSSARKCLSEAGYDQVTVLLADAEHGVPDHSPFDRLIVTVGAWDIPPAWISQLTDGGRIVLPLRLRGLTRSVAFERDGDHLVSQGYRLCGFVPMQGAGEHVERMVPLDGDEVGLRVDGDPGLDTDALRESLFSPRIERWSGVVFDQVDGMDFFVATTAPGFGLLTATSAAIERGLVGPSAIRGVPTIVRGGSFAYRTKRPIEGTDDFETGVLAHGPNAEEVAQEYVDLLRAWDRDHRHGAGARIEVHPVTTPAAGLGKGLVVDKIHTRIVISWP